jgi:hypothetical protein
MELGLEQALSILVFSVRDGFVQVSAFVAITVLLFSYLQYRTGGRATDFLERHEALQPIAGGLLGLTPGCGGAIVVMPLYIRGTVSFGTVVAALAATAGDSAFVVLAVAPKAAIVAYAIAFVAGVTFGYMVDFWGLGIGRVDRAVEHIGGPVTDDGFSTKSVAEPGPRACHCSDTASANSETSDDVSSFFTALSHGVHVAWWIVAIVGLVAGVVYLQRGAPEVALAFGPTFDGVFTVAGLCGTLFSFYLYFVGRHYLDEAEADRIRESFSSGYETFKHAAIETSMVTVWVIAAYLLYEYSIGLFGLDIKALAEAAGVGAPLAGVALGLVPGCAPQIVFAGLYTNGSIPFSALAANAISQDGDALFPLMAIDMKAAIVATIYTTIPATAVALLLYYLWPFVRFGFGVV